MGWSLGEKRTGCKVASKIGIAIEGRTFEVRFDLNSGGPEITVWVNDLPLQVVLPECDAEGNCCFVINNRPLEAAAAADFSYVQTNLGVHRVEVWDLAGISERFSALYASLRSAAREVATEPPRPAPEATREPVHPVWQGA